jgi:HlyD family secretion protein
MCRIFKSLSQRLHALSAALLLSLTVVPLANAQEKMPVTVVVASPAEMTEKIPVVGSLVAREEIQVHPLVEGRVIEDILVEVGQSVKKGQPLVVLDTTEARMLHDRNSVSVLRAQTAVEVEASRVDVAKVTEAEALKVLDRSRALQPKGAVSQQVLDEHENKHMRAVAELALARHSLALAQADAQLIARERQEIELTIDRSTVRSPEAGLVLRRSARTGAMTSASSGALFVIAKNSTIEFATHVTETSFIRLAEGMRATIALPGYGGPLGGTVRLNAAELDPVTRSGEVRIELDETTGLKSGSFARGSIEAAARRNIFLPGSAVKTAGGTSTVFVVKDGIVDMRPVIVGTRQEGVVEIVNGLLEGEMVVLRSGGFLKSQERVWPVIAATKEHPIDHLASSVAITHTEMAR